MQKKYNIALTPLTKQADFVRLSQQLAPLRDTYQLGKHSLPHVTLCHFIADPITLPSLWQSACTLLSPHTLKLHFQGAVNEYTRDNRLFWLSLLPDERTLLDSLHEKTARLTGMPVNPDYLAHLTLINTRNTEYQGPLQTFQEGFTPVEDTFVLSLGESDHCGQLTRLIETTPPDSLM